MLSEYPTPWRVAQQGMDFQLVSVNNLIILGPSKNKDLLEHIANCVNEEAKFGQLIEITLQQFEGRTDVPALKKFADAMRRES